MIHLAYLLLFGMVLLKLVLERLLRRGLRMLLAYHRSCLGLVIP
jgi:hypothetical protein